MEIVLLKFGGLTLTRNHLPNVLKHIKNKLEKFKVICVVSAVGRMGSPYATDTLKNLVSNDLDKEEMDRLLACGETISSVVLSDFLNNKGIKAKSIKVQDIGMLTDNNYTDANIIEVKTDKIEEYFKNYDCVIVPGFQAVNFQGNITTIGRGGSDTTAIALGYKIKAKYIEIISDIAGIYSGDPKIIIRPKFFPKISYNQLLKITLNGSKVLHYKAAKIAYFNHIKIRFKSIDHTGLHTSVIDDFKDFKNVSFKKGFLKYEVEEIIKPNFENYIEENTIYIPEQKKDEFEKIYSKYKYIYDNLNKYVRITQITNEVENYTFVTDDSFIEKINEIHDAMFRDPL